MTTSGETSRSATVATLRTTTILWIPNDLVLRTSRKGHDEKTVTKNDVEDLFQAIKKTASGSTLTNDESGYTISVPENGTKMQGLVKTLCTQRHILLAGNIRL